MLNKCHGAKVEWLTACSSLQLGWQSPDQGQATCGAQRGQPRSAPPPRPEAGAYTATFRLILRAVWVSSFWGPLAPHGSSPHPSKSGRWWRFLRWAEATGRPQCTPRAVNHADAGRLPPPASTCSTGIGFSDHKRQLCAWAPHLIFHRGFSMNPRVTGSLWGGGRRGAAVGPSGLRVHDSWVFLCS